jgi:ABC-type sugar transport system ATPase subunit
METETAITKNQPEPGDDLQAPLLSLHDVTKSFFGVTVLHGVSFDVYPREVLCLVGENGSGKSTTMNILTVFIYAMLARLHWGSTTSHAVRSAENAGIAFIQQG